MTEIPAEVRPLCHLILTHASHGGVHWVRIDRESYAVIDGRRWSMLTDWAVQVLFARGLVSTDGNHVTLTEAGVLVLAGWNAEVLGVDPIDAEDETEIC